MLYYRSTLYIYDTQQFSNITTASPTDCRPARVLYLHAHVLVSLCAQEVLAHDEVSRSQQILRHRAIGQTASMPALDGLAPPTAAPAEALDHERQTTVVCDEAVDAAEDTTTVVDLGLVEGAVGSDR